MISTDSNFFVTEVLEKLVNSVNSFPKRNSFCIAGTYYSYAQLAQKISNIRQAILEASVDERIVAIAIHDDLETYASIFALWMQGKGYVPLHPNQPIDRNLNIMSQLGIHNVIDSSSESPFNQFNVINPTQLEDVDLFLNEWVTVPADSLAYILFTSGSTGQPKGVQLTRENVGSFMDSFWKTGIEIDEHDRCMQIFDLTFDVSVQSYLVPLTKGACCYTVPYGQVKYVYAASLIQDYQITFGAMAPSMLTYLKPYFSEIDASSMKACILTAEACPVDLMEDWYQCAKNTEIYDFYGPTEATIYCTYYKLSRTSKNLSLNGIISIGKPLANVQAIIINENGELVKGQEKGELCVAGSQVTPGYWKNQEKNESSFFVREYNGQPIRFYHTGDLCYWEENGNIMYSGRIDQQAKIQGFRVELGEIEFHAREFFNKNIRVMAIAYNNQQSLTEIALFIEKEQMDSTELISYLRSKMPRYMIPTQIIYEPVFPLNKSEKVDRNALKLRLNS